MQIVHILSIAFAEEETTAMGRRTFDQAFLLFSFFFPERAFLRTTETGNVDRFASEEVTRVIASLIESLFGDCAEKCRN